ncbi:MAG TPA: glycosyltransferase [Kofleriaceae bacterium]|nr:glycosyltransferase [Kofleriaceae bacterium]
MSPSSIDLSVIVPFSDHEDTIGAAVKRIADHLQDWAITFEIVCVDEDSGDNSQPLLALLRKSIPALVLATAPGRGQGFAVGAAAARGRVLWLTDPVSALAPLPAAHDVYAPVAAGQVDAAMVAGAYALCRRARCLPILNRIRAADGLSADLVRRFSRRARARKLTVTAEIGGEAIPKNREGSLGRLLQALMPL